MWVCVCESIGPRLSGSFLMMKTTHAQHIFSHRRDREAGEFQGICALKQSTWYGNTDTMFIVLTCIFDFRRMR